MSNDVLITPASRKIELKDSGGNVDAKIETDGSGNLQITNPGGDISIGDTTADVFIGDGTNSVDIVFEQNGEIRGTSGVTLTLGDANTTLRTGTDLSLNSNDITNVANITTTNMSLSGTMTLTGAIDYTPDNGTLIKFDGQNILTRNTANGAITFGHDDAILITAGDTTAVMNANINEATETIFLGAEGGFVAYAFPNNDTTWTNREELKWDGSNLSINGTNVINAAGAWVGSDSGIKGQKGQKGEVGQKGQKGQAGTNGTDGDKGQKGQAGTNGTDGDKGQKGEVGQKGQKGQAGTNGTDGDKGQKGQAGTNGTDGDKGQKGATGSKGQKGQAGTNGTDGDKGQKGEVGQKGQKGATGSKGQKGEVGQKGQKGATGSKGQKGEIGLTDAPYGAVPAYSNSVLGTITWNATEEAMSLRSSSDTQIGAAFPAFRVNLASNETHKLSIKLKSNTTTTSGVYIRVYEYNAALPSGKVAVSNSASYALVQEDTSGKTNWRENQGVTTSWVTHEYTYTPTAGAQWASIVVLNWSGLGTNYLYIRDPMWQLIGSSGAKGQKGATGSKGQKGEVGQKGQKGATGSKGQKGEVGQKGQKGATGSKGQKGEVGQKGQKGQTGATGPTGNVSGSFSTTGYVESGRGSGGVAMTINDGYGNANLTFNHRSGVPEQNGQAARIEVNTDSGSGKGYMYFETSNAAVTGGTPVSLTSAMTVHSTGVEIPQYLYHMGDSNTYLQFTADRIRLVAAGTTKFDSNNTYLTGNQTITLTGDATGSGTTSIATTIGDTQATANTVAKRTSSGDLKVRLVRANYGNQSSISGAMAFRVNNGSDDYVRFCNNTANIRSYLNAASLSSNTFSGDQTIQKALPKLTLDSLNGGDGWTSQGAQISLGESGDGGSAALHLTYHGNGYGYVGMGTVGSTTGIPAYGHLRFQYNANTINCNATWNIGVSRHLKMNGTTVISSGRSIENVVNYQNTDGHMQLHRTANAPLIINRKGTTGASGTSRGEILNFKSNDTKVGRIGYAAPYGGVMYLTTGNTSGCGLGVYSFSTSGYVFPATLEGALKDNSMDLGSTSGRWDDVYATNGTIQTSDRNEKQDIQALTDAEQRVATACKGLIRRFRWVSSVEEKGDDARYHFGAIAQDVEAAFTAEGLDAGDYGLFIRSTWWEHEGHSYPTAEAAPTGAVQKTRLGIRYNQLLAFIISAL